MNDAADFAKLVPGFDFLQSLAKGAGAALPGIGQWVAPTLDPDEIDKRIKELRTVQFWLEQNVRMLATTIQALEVQRMTLSTLQTMNVQMTDLRESMKIKPAAGAAAPAPRATARATAKGAAAPGSVVDPMQWWGALTNQFAQLATSALKETSTDAAKTLAGTMLKQSLDTASSAFKDALPAARADAARAPARAPRPRAAAKR